MPAKIHSDLPLSPPPLLAFISCEHVNRISAILGITSEYGKNRIAVKRRESVSGICWGLIGVTGLQGGTAFEASQ